MERWLAVDGGQFSVFAARDPAKTCRTDPLTKGRFVPAKFRRWKKPKCPCYGVELGIDHHHNQAQTPAMGKRGATLLATAGFAALVAIVSVSTSKREPSYQGRLLSEWLRTWDTNSAGDSSHDTILAPEAERAIRYIGSNAIPQLLRWISYEPSGLKEPINQLAVRFRNRPIREFLARHSWRASDAEIGFSVLGPQASSAVPELTRLAITSSAEGRNHRCIRSLAAIGQEGIPGLITVATNARALGRAYAINQLGRCSRDLQTAMAALLICLNDIDDPVAAAAADVIGLHALSPSNTLPHLIKALHGTNVTRQVHAARALLRFRSPSTSMAPELQQRVLAELRQLPADVNTNKPVQ